MRILHRAVSPPTRTALLRLLGSIALAALFALTPEAGDAAEPQPGAAAGRAEWLYVSNEDEGTVTVIATETLKPLRTIDAGRRPRGIRLSPDGRTLYVAVSGTPKCPPSVPDEVCARRKSDPSQDGIAVLDAASGRRRAVLPGGSDPEQFDVSPDGRRLVVANEDAGLASLVDIASGRVLKSVAVGGEPEGVRIAPDGRLALVTSESDHLVALLDAKDVAPIARIAVGRRPRDIVFARDGRTAFVSAELEPAVSVVDVAARRLARTLKMPPGSLPMGVALSADGRRLFVAGGRSGKVYRLDAGSGRIEAETGVGRRPWGIALSADGRRLFSANGPSNDVTVLDAETFGVIARIPVGASPWGLAIGPALK